MVTGELSFDSKALRLTDKGACLFSIELSYCEKRSSRYNFCYPSFREPRGKEANEVS